MPRESIFLKIFVFTSCGTLLLFLSHFWLVQASIQAAIFELVSGKSAELNGFRKNSLVARREGKKEGGKEGGRKGGKVGRREGRREGRKDERRFCG